MVSNSVMEQTVGIDKAEVVEELRSKLHLELIPDWCFVSKGTVDKTNDTIKCDEAIEFTQHAQLKVSVESSMMGESGSKADSLEMYYISQSLKENLKILKQYKKELGKKGRKNTRKIAQNVGDERGITSKEAKGNMYGDTDADVVMLSELWNNTQGFNGIHSVRKYDKRKLSEKLGFTCNVVVEVMKSRERIRENSIDNNAEAKRFAAMINKDLDNGRCNVFQVKVLDFSVAAACGVVCYFAYYPINTEIKVVALIAEEKIKLFTDRICEIVNIRAREIYDKLLDDNTYCPDDVIKIFYGLSKRSIIMDKGTKVKLARANYKFSRGEQNG